MIRPRHAKHALHARASNVQRAITHALGMLLKQHLTKSERAWNVHWRASNARQMVQSVFNAPQCSARGTYSGRISHTPETRRAFRKN